jgi:hypothetical protein
MEEEEMTALVEVSFAEEYLRQIELINLKFSEKVRVFKGNKILKKKNFSEVLSEDHLRQIELINRAHSKLSEQVSVSLNIFFDKKSEILIDELDLPEVIF